MLCSTLTRSCWRSRLLLQEPRASLTLWAFSLAVHLLIPICLLHSSPPESWNKSQAKMPSLYFFSLVTIGILCSCFWLIYDLSPYLSSDLYNCFCQADNQCLPNCWVQWKILALVALVPLRYLALLVFMPSLSSSCFQILALALAFSSRISVSGIFFKVVFPQDSSPCPHLQDWFLLSELV